MTRTDQIIEVLEDLKEDDVPRRMAVRIDEMIMVLREDIDIELRVDRVRSILEELDAESNIPAYVRTQLWNISAMLEML